MTLAQTLRAIVPLFVGLLCATSAQAARIDFYVIVPGYSSAGWIAVRPELRNILGGRVANLPQYGGWVTDRVSRGETVQAMVSANVAGERTIIKGVMTGIVYANGVAFSSNILPYYRGDLVSRNPAADGVKIWVLTQAGYFERSVPIGSR